MRGPAVLLGSVWIGRCCGPPAIHAYPVVGTACRCGPAVPTTISTASTGVVMLVPVVQGRATVSLCHGDASFLYVLTSATAALAHI